MAEEKHIQEEPRKTLKDYLLKGRAINRYFATNREPTAWGISLGGYLVKGICHRREFPEDTDLMVVAIGCEEDIPISIHLGAHLDDKEIFPYELDGIIQIFEEKQAKRLWQDNAKDRRKL